MTALVTGDKSLSNSFRDVLRRCGKNHLVAIRIVRTPLSRTLMTALNTIDPRVSSKIEQKPYDKLFHLRVDLSLDSGVVVGVEKQQLPHASTNPRVPAGSEVFEAPVRTHGVTLQLLVDNAM